MPACISASCAAGSVNHLRRPTTCHHQVVLEKGYGQKWDVMDVLNLPGLYPEVSEVLMVNCTLPCLGKEEVQRNSLKIRPRRWI